MSDPPEVITIHGAVPADLLASCRVYIENLDPAEFDEYTHRFEPKLMVKKRHYAEQPLAALLCNLRSYRLCDWLAELFRVPVPGMFPASDYFTAFYVYRPGDYLQSHLDAAVHEQERKIVTVNLYLSDCVGGELRVGRQIFPSQANTIVAFLNTDNSCHGVEPVKSGKRIMVTTAFSVPAEFFPRPRFQKMNQKAYFVPGPGEVWGEQEYKARDERASADWRSPTENPPESSTSQAKFWMGSPVK
jgi:hypothetical protein